MASTISDKNPHLDISQSNCRTQGVKKIIKTSERDIEQRMYRFHIKGRKSFIRY